MVKIQALSMCFLEKRERKMEKKEKKSKEKQRRDERNSHYLSPEPELSCQVFLHDIIGELDTEVTACPLIGNNLIHHLHADVQDLEIYNSP